MSDHFKRKKAKVLISYYRDSNTVSLNRVYLEPDFNIAQLDYELLSAVATDKEVELRDIELYAR